MAHTKAKGTSRLGRDSVSKRLGVKVFGGQKIRPGMIIVRQRGSRFFAGQGVKIGADDTLYAQKEGTVNFQKKRIRRFSGRLADKTVISIA